MAERRMFAKTIIDSDAFLDMPLSAQALYFHLSMRADDEGFINNPKKIQRMIGASDDDLKLLVAKSFIIPFESGIVVIKHWKIHNYIRGDRLTETKYIEEREMLSVKENGAYTISDSIKAVECRTHDRQATDTRPTYDRQVSVKRPSSVSQVTVKCQSSDGHMTDTRPSSDGELTANRPQSDNQATDICPQNDRIGKVSIGKGSIDKGSTEECIAAEPPRTSETPLIDNTEKTEKPVKHKYGIFNHVLLLDDELSKLVAEYGLVETNEAIKYLDEYIEMKGTKYKSHYLALRKWVYDAVKEQKQRSQKIQPAKLNSFNNVSSLQHESPQFDTIAELIESGAFD